MSIKVTSKADKAVKPAAAGKAIQKGKKGIQKGLSGNPNGRPEGSRNWATRIAEQMLEEDAEAIIGAVIEKARGGYFPAQKFLMERLLPPKRTRPISIALPSIETAADVSSAVDKIWSAVGSGMITPDESEHLQRLLETKRKAIETHDLAAQIKIIKEQLEAVLCRRVR